MIFNKKKKNNIQDQTENERTEGLSFEAIPDENDENASEHEDNSDEEPTSSFFATAELDIKEIRDCRTLDDEISRAVSKTPDNNEHDSTESLSFEEITEENNKTCNTDSSENVSSKPAPESKDVRKDAEAGDDDDLGIEIFDLNDRINSHTSDGNRPDRQAENRRFSKDSSGSSGSAVHRKKSVNEPPQKLSAQKKSAQKSSSAKRKASRPEETKKGISLQLILLLIILAIAASAVIIFVMWNKGKDASVKEGEVTNSYSVEVNDEMVYLPDSKLEGHGDDGKTTVLCLGNEPFSDDLSDTGLAGQIEELSGAEVINASFPNSQVTCLKRKYDPSPETRDDIFNLFYVANSINLNDFTAMETVASLHDDDGRYMNSVNTLKNVDFDSVDMIAIMYDAADYLNGMSMQNPDDKDDLTTYVNSLSYSFKLIQDKYPWIRIVFMSPYYVNVDNSDSRTNNIGNGTLVNYFQWSFDTCGSNSVSFIDDYYGSVNENNYKEYTTDGLHLNEAGRTKIADHFVYKVLQDNYSEYDVDKLMAVTDGN